MAGVRYVTPETLQERTRAWLAASRAAGRPRPLPSLDRAALLVVDVQRYFADPSSHAFLPALEAVWPRIEQLLRSFRAAGRPVVLTRQGSEGDAPTLMRRWWGDDLRRGEPRAELAYGLAAEPGELLLDKQRYSAFCGTELAAELARRGCDVVVICGLMTHLCCETTARDAFMRELQPVVVADACAAPDEDLHLGALRNLAHGFAPVAATADLCGAAPEHASTEDPLAAPRELVVIGAGPAGIAAAIQAARSGVDVLLLEREVAGGLARTANLVENYPGHPGGIAGAALMARFAGQLAAAGVCPVTAEVIAVEAAPELCLRLGGRDLALPAHAVIVATGTAPIALPLGDAPAAHRVDALRTVRDHRVLVIGGGEAALDQALLARRRGAREVLVACRAAVPRAMALLVERAAAQGVALWRGTVVEEVRRGAGNLRATLRRDSEAIEVEIDDLVVCVGRAAALPQLPEHLARDRCGAVRVDALGRTSIPGLYLAGDARRGRFRQVGIAVGDGLAAAMHAREYLRTHRWAADPDA